MNQSLRKTLVSKWHKSTTFQVVFITFFTLRPIRSNLPAMTRSGLEEYYDHTQSLKSSPRPLRIQFWGMISQKAR
jgi:hypothetical protein